MVAPTVPDQLGAIIRAIHYGYPASVIVYFLVALSVTVCTLQTRKLRAKDQHVRRDVMLGLIFAVALNYVLETFTIVLEIFLTGAYPAQDLVIYLMASTIAFGVQCLALKDSKFPVWYPYYGTWFLGLAVELPLLILPNVFRPPKNFFDLAVLLIQTLRICSFIILPSMYFGLRSDDKKYDDSDVERQSLLGKRAGKNSSSQASTANGNDYGTAENGAQNSDTANGSSDASEDSYLERRRKIQAKINKRLEEDGNWLTYAKSFTIFFPYIWPYHNRLLQCRALLVCFCLLATNALNVLVPTQMGVMIDSLTNYHNGDKSSKIWLPIAIYASLRFISGGAGIGWLKTWLWMPLEQYSYDALSTASHAHLMSLSSDFHDSKISSDVTQAVHGGRSISDLLDLVCFQVVPMFIDLTVAFAYLWILFGAYVGLMMVSTAATYLYITTKLYSRRAQIRRDYITVYRKEYTIGQQSLDGWSTASLFNMIPYERSRYSGAVKEHMKSKGDYETSYHFISACQALILTFGLLGALWLGVYQVAYQDQSVGRFATLLVYWGQLESPLSFFSSMYRQISYSLMDAERLLELFQTKPTIIDRPDAKPLQLGKGVVRFDNVSFAYDERKPTLTDVTFEVSSGKTMALVGETGGGKSTILKLIDRFYEVKSGLRENIGVVPQDPMLFNDSIMNNIRYARLSASDEEVHEACKAAAVHEKILSFPDGGLTCSFLEPANWRAQATTPRLAIVAKLSGGEKQRVAIARAILKRPNIILLDEATSAVDTETEQLIQAGFKTLCHGRTTFIVAHRLSTIMKADQILVLLNGKIVEHGSHDDLVHTKGKYHDLWSKQIFVKPLDSRSRSRSPLKTNLGIINDLTPTRHKIELAKALKKTAHPREAPAADESKHSGDGGKSDIEKTADDSHKREGSTLKPDAPEFVPVRFKPSLLAAREAAKAQKKMSKVEKKVASLTKKAGKRAAKYRGMDGNVSTADESQPVRASDDVIDEGEMSAAEKPIPKRPRYADRRLQTKSEPAEATRLSDSLDGQQDSENISSGEGQPLLQPASAQRRRVSAPSDPPAQQTTRNTRSRRNRHWRLKNRTRDDVSGSSSMVASSGTSNDDTGHSHPAPPLPSPAAGVITCSKIPQVTFAMPLSDGV
ncbi:ABC transporter [Marssonina coronariae]|uniref:ABC transporter n=1 Tax=Diplocarpon coronariae TaxID=2795749 RepID=A0A218Z354_9HELO|nr:ABC transporter [Marssonina coronariae]